MAFRRCRHRGGVPVGKYLSRTSAEGNFNFRFYRKLVSSVRWHDDIQKVRRRLCDEADLMPTNHFYRSIVVNPPDCLQILTPHLQ